MENLIGGFATVFQPATLLYCFIGVFLGTVVGILPGLGPLTTIALLLPITYKMDVTSAIIMLSGIYYGVAYGGTVTSVLMRIPGEASSVITCLDGYEMARKGRAGAALGIAAMGSFFAGTVGVLAISYLSPPLSRWVLAFGPAEYSMVMLAGLALVTYFSSGSKLKALLMAAFGLLLGTVGSDPQTGSARLTFGVFHLIGGIDLVPLAIGLFGISEVLSMALGKPEKMKVLPPPSTLLGFMPNRDEARRSVAPVARGTVLGFLVGLIPGGGAVLATFLSYATERKLSKRPEEFGKGAVEGLAGPEAANNAGTAGAFVPLLCMGVPANAVTALLLGAFMIHGVAPGPTIMERQPEIFWGIVASMYVGNVMLLILNLPLIGLFVRVLDVPRAWLAPIILMVCLIGVYSTNSAPMDVLLAVMFGVIGYILRRYGYDLGIVILAYVLGGIFERSVRRALAISDGELSIFVSTPISIAFAVITVILVVIAFIPRRVIAPALEKPTASEP
ncbi:tripartite tricarboxylate transporter permease [Quisquiliibacterium transsilvanicum]|uniref:Putative tricarboxylic transport membrane protein n=1 Tax=Quisquiliibacterium transsilvanicum TaxID=1549638 RepID=A0A7W8HKA9_9BURK|nr:tripartite tricarboxylate transporter permease [Quisquiliibacterium transsilvanicum]MBB5273457.1 putative tricarboxylic transport membrane protein [Quisquiliibacterium transsilvanicum]